MLKQMFRKLLSPPILAVYPTITSNSTTTNHINTRNHSTTTSSSKTIRTMNFSKKPKGNLGANFSSYFNITIIWFITLFKIFLYKIELDERRYNVMPFCGSRGWYCSLFYCLRREDFAKYTIYENNNSLEKPISLFSENG